MCLRRRQRQWPNWWRTWLSPASPLCCLSIEIKPKHTFLSIWRPPRVHKRRLGLLFSRCLQSWGCLPLVSCRLLWNFIFHVSSKSSCKFGGFGCRLSSRRPKLLDDTHFVSKMHSPDPQQPTAEQVVVFMEAKEERKKKRNQYSNTKLKRPTKLQQTIPQNQPPNKSTPRHQSPKIISNKLKTEPTNQTSNNEQ